MSADTDTATGVVIESRLRIGGRDVPAAAGRTYQVHSPANGALVAEAADAGEALSLIHI